MNTFIDTIASTLKRSLVLALLAGGLFVVSCEYSDGVRLRFGVEKDLFEATKTRELLQIRPEQITPEQLASLRGMYERAFRRSLAAIDSVDFSRDSLSWKELNVLAFTAAYQTQEMDYNRGAYASAHELLTELLTKTRLPRTLYIQSRLSLGRASQSLGRWEEAVKIYDDITDNFYPPIEANGEVILPAVNLPFEIYVAEKNSGSEEAAHNRSARMLSYYNKLRQSFPENAELARLLNRNFAVYYRYEGEYERALDHIATLTDSAGNPNPEALFERWEILSEYMGQPQTAILEMEAKKFMGRDTGYTPMLLYQLARRYLTVQDFDSCRAKIYTIKSNYPRMFGTNAEPQALLAASFGVQDNWERAENEFRFLIDTYPYSREAFEAHLDLVKYFTRTSDSRKVEFWKKRAKEFYDRAAQQYGGTELEAQAHRLQAEIYRLTAEWRSCAEALTIAAQKFPETDVGRTCALAGAEVYRLKLDNPTMADSLVRIFRRSFPGGAGAANLRSETN